MKPIFDNLAAEALRMKNVLGSNELAGKRGMWLLLAVEAICRQESCVALPQDNEAELTEGIEIITEMILNAASAYGKPEPLSSQQFWRDFILALCMAWGGPAVELSLKPDQLYAVQIRRLRDSQSH